ncbi:hypothetical protein BJY52DRAFT_1224140 [Lactarius psammicola]|nr:hypothetical protein BJY52DRAFT_1224140 [Lactarius psammicola]
MSFLPVNANTLLQGSEATLIPDEGFPVMAANAAAQLEAMRTVCYQPLQILDTPYNILNAAQFGEHQALRESAISETYQLELVRVACCQLLQVLGSSYTISNIAQFGGHQVLRESAISQVTFASTHLEFVLVACYRLLQVLPGEYNATQLGEHQVLADNVPPIQPAGTETAQPTDAQEAAIPAGGDTSDKWRCLFEGCKATFGRLQEHKRHLIDVHTPRRRCPFCLYEWSRPDKIKNHLMTKHQDKPQVLNEIHSKRGQHLVAFLDTL